MLKYSKENHNDFFNKILQSHNILNNIVKYTPLEFIERLSNKYKADIYLKREDQQIVRSYKIRGAYNNMINLNKNEKLKGIVCASAGNHAQGVAYSCNKLKIYGYIFMPKITSQQKIDKVKYFGSEWIHIELLGNNYDESYSEAIKFSELNNIYFIHAFDNINTIIGQGTIGIEIINSIPDADVVIVPVGGGGLLAGICLSIKKIKPNCKIIGIDPLGAPKMLLALKKGKPVLLNHIDTFVDGAAIKQVGKITYEIISQYINNILTVPEGKVCDTIIDLYQHEGIIVEPAGALSAAALDQIKNIIKGKKVVCIISGGNNDIKRYTEIIGRSLIFNKMKYYLLIHNIKLKEELKYIFNNLLPNKDKIYIIDTAEIDQNKCLFAIELSNSNNIKLITNYLNKHHIKYDDITSKYLF